MTRPRIKVSRCKNCDFLTEATKGKCNNCGYKKETKEFTTTELRHYEWFLPLHSKFAKRFISWECVGKYNHLYNSFAGDIADAFDKEIEDIKNLTWWERLFKMF